MSSSQLRREFFEMLERIAAEKPGKARPPATSQPEPTRLDPVHDASDEVRAAVRELFGASDE